MTRVRPKMQPGDPSAAALAQDEAQAPKTVRKSAKNRPPKKAASDVARQVRETLDAIESFVTQQQALAKEVALAKPAEIEPSALRRGPMGPGLAGALLRGYPTVAAEARARMKENDEWLAKRKAAGEWPTYDPPEEARPKLSAYVQAFLALQAKAARERSNAEHDAEYERWEYDEWEWLKYQEELRNGYR